MAATPPSLLEAVQAGSYRDSLVTLRDTLALAIDERPPARDLAALTNRLQSVLATLDALPDPTGERSAADELARRRASRHTDAPDRARASE